MPNRRQPITICYVEDEAADVLAMESMLNEWHIINPLRVFPSGELLLASIKSGDVEPGIVLVDMCLPFGMDGLSIIRALRQPPEVVPTIPLVMVTGSDDASAVEMARMSGADAYIVKPVGVPGLMKAINQAAPFMLEIVRSSK